MSSPIPVSSASVSAPSPAALLASTASGSPASPSTSNPVAASPSPRRAASRQQSQKYNSWLDFSSVQSSRTRQSAESLDPVLPPPLAIEAQAAPHQSFRDWYTSPRVHQHVLIHHSLTHNTATDAKAKRHKTQRQQQPSRGGATLTNATLSNALPEPKVPTNVPLTFWKKLGSTTNSDVFDITSSYSDRYFAVTYFYLIIM